jgi:hypothetical protein
MIPPGIIQASPHPLAALHDHPSRGMLRAKAGDRWAVEESVRTTSSAVHQLCRYLGYPADPDDLTQEMLPRCPDPGTHATGAQLWRGPVWAATRDSSDPARYR